MDEKQYTLRFMVDETIIGGPLVRQIPERGTLFMLVEKTENGEVIRAYCRRVIWDQWGSFTVAAFRRVGGDGTQDDCIERIVEEVVITETMIVYQVPIEEWMSRKRPK